MNKENLRTLGYFTLIAAVTATITLYAVKSESEAPKVEMVQKSINTEMQFLKKVQLRESQPKIAEGSLVSLECFQPQGWYMRHFNFMVLAQADDKKPIFKLASSWIIDAGLDNSNEMEDGAYLVSIRSLEYPDYYLRVMNGFSIVLHKFEQSYNYSRDATFIVRKGLVDTNLYSFELLSQPGFFLRQLNDQVVAAKRLDIYQYKDDATWFLKPALAKVDFMSIDFNQSAVTTETIPDETLFRTTYTNSDNLPLITKYLQPYQGMVQSEFFIKSTGFNMIRGMTYRINAHQPRVDVDGKVFFTMKNVREWTYGEVNMKNQSLLFDEQVFVQEEDNSTLSVSLKKIKVSIPFEAQVRFEGVEFEQSYQGVWHGQIAYNYLIEQRNARQVVPLLRADLKSTEEKRQTPTMTSDEIDNENYQPQEFTTA